MTGFSLFDDGQIDETPELRTGGIIREGDIRKVRENPVIGVLWKQWSKITQRPHSEPEKKFSAEVRKLSTAGIDDGALSTRVELAAYLPTNPRDKADTKRVIKAMQGGAGMRQAISLKSRSAPRYMFGDVILKTELDVFMVMCGFEVGELYGTEMEIADTLCQMHDENSLREKVESLRNGESMSILPSDVKRGKLLESGRYTKGRKSAINGYNIGAAEMETDDTSTFWLDIEAENMLMRGVNRKSVAAFHKSAPDGFWNAVLESLSSMSPEQAVRHQEKIYNFNLSSRTL